MSRRPQSSNRCLWLAAGVFAAVALVLPTAAPAQVKGDLNDDGSLTAADALLLQRVLEDQLTLPDESVADVAPIGGGTAGDGGIDTADLLVLLRALQGDDLDGDGLGTEGENAIGTSAFLEDTDGDGLEDPSDPNPLLWDPDPPVLDPPTADPTSENPYPVTGTGEPDTEILLYVAGELQATTVSAGDGSFTVPAVLLDGANSVHATARVSPIESGPSNSITLNYLNNTQRIYTNGDTISQDTVWTAGDGTPYQIDRRLTVASGVTLTIQPGVEVRLTGGFARGEIYVLGTIRVLGEAGNEVTFTSGESTPATWDYMGIQIKQGSTGNVIDHAVFEYAGEAISVASEASITNNAFEQFATGIEVTETAYDVLIDDNVFTGVAGAIETGIWVSGSSPTITRNEMTSVHGGIAIVPTTVEASPFIDQNTFTDVPDPGNAVNVGINILGGPTNAMITNNTITGYEWGIMIYGEGPGGDVVSPTISGNTLTGNDVALRIEEGPVTAVISFNTITGNEIGIELRGAGPGGSNPNPTVNRNDLSGNTNYALLIGDDFDPEQATLLDFRENWWGDTSPSAILDEIGFENAEDTQIANLPIDFSDFLGAAGGDPIVGAHLTTPITNVVPTVRSFRPSLGQTAGIGFTLLQGPADVQVSIYTEDDALSATPKRVLPVVTYGAGDHQVSWDGKDDAGLYVADEAYRYVLTTTFAGSTTKYDPPVSSDLPDFLSTGYGGGLVYGPPAYNPFRNESFWFMGTPTGLPMRWRLEVYYTCGINCYYPGYNVFLDRPFPTNESTHFRWDGRKPSGEIDAGADRVVLWIPIGTRQHTVVIDDAPAVLNGGGGPAIDVRADPFLIVPSFGQVARIPYQVDQPSFVKVKLLPPGVYDPANAAAILLKDEGPTPEPANTALEVAVTGAVPGSPAQLLLDQNGTYTFTIEARSEQTGVTTLYRGALQVRP